MIGFFSQLKAIENMREGRMAKLYLEWSEPWWNHGEGFLNFAWSREVLTLFPQCRLFLIPEKKKCKRMWKSGFSKPRLWPRLSLIRITRVQPYGFMKVKAALVGWPCIFTQYSILLDFSTFCLPEKLNLDPWFSQKMCLIAARPHLSANRTPD